MKSRQQAATSIQLANFMENRLCEGTEYSKIPAAPNNRLSPGFVVVAPVLCRVPDDKGQFFWTRMAKLNWKTLQEGYRIITRRSLFLVLKMWSTYVFNWKSLDDGHSLGLGYLGLRDPGPYTPACHPGATRRWAVSRSSIAHSPRP
jgi:hypothetical protein